MNYLLAYSIGAIALWVIFVEVRLYLLQKIVKELTRFAELSIERDETIANVLEMIAGMQNTQNVGPRERLH